MKYFNTLIFCLSIHKTISEIRYLKNSFILRFAFILLLGLHMSLVCHAQFLKTNGSKIVDPANNEVILRGIGLGGWMLQEGYMLRTSGPQHEIETKITELIGEEKTQEFYDAWLANHFRKIDVDSLASWGFNSIRLPMHYKLFTPPIEEEPVPGEITFIDKGFDMVDDLVSWCRDNNIYIILDMHAAPGGQGENADISDYDPTKSSLWESQANQDKLVAVWKKLAERYADEPQIAAYDLINETNWGFQDHENDPNGCSENQSAPLWNLQKRITEAIREVDVNHIIIIEGNCWGNNYSGMPSLWDSNIVISYHKYWNTNAPSSIQGMIAMRQQRNVPIWLGETGENSNTWFTDAISLLESNGIGWSWWPHKKMGGNNPLEIKVKSGYQEILNYWSGSGAKPTEESAYDALMQVTEDLKLENNVFHKDVVDAMIRQPHSDEAIPFTNHDIIPNETNRVFATNYDLGKHGIAYHDDEVTNETGNAGGLTWNLGRSYRNDGVDIEACHDEITNGYNVGWTADGEWLQYTLDVDSSGVYQADIRYAVLNDGSAIKLLVNNADQSAVVELPATGGYQTWGTHSVQDVILYEGKQQLRLFIETGGVNINYLEFTLKKKISEVSFKPVSGKTSESENKIYLTLNKKIDVSSVENSGFTCTVNGHEVDIASIVANPESDQILALDINAELNDGSQITLDYDGDQIVAMDGSSLETFSNLEIENNLPTHLAIPGQIEAEIFNVNQGLETETTTDVGGGENIGYTNTGDFLEYLINVQDSGEYRLEVRIACESQAGIFEVQQLSLDGELLNAKEIQVPVTGGWQTWQTISTKMTLDNGRSKLRVEIIQPEFNINWYRFSFLGVVNGMEDSQQGFLIYPNPVKDTLNIRLSDEISGPENLLSIRNLHGQLIFQRSGVQNEEEINLNPFSFQSGLYIVELMTSDLHHVKKFWVE